MLSQFGNNPAALKAITEQLSLGRGGAGGEEDLPELEGTDFEAVSRT